MPYKLRCAFVVAFALLVTVSAFAQPTPPPIPPGFEPVKFCNQVYALCIKAPCSPIVSRDKDGNYSVTEANCRCVVVDGWSMGPGECDKRAVTTASDGNKYLVSTYSNFFNKTDLTLTCSSNSTTWAWCYGSPCVISKDNPSDAVCTCPIQIGPAKTLGGRCQQEKCNQIWSAATYKNDAFANDYFYWYMTHNNLQPPPNKAAQDCPTTPPPPSK